MTTPQSPTRIFNGLDEDLYSEAKFAHEINEKMRVPKRIKATGEHSDEDLLLSNQNRIINSWNHRDNLDMNVPDRIVVLAENDNLKKRFTPREIQLENSISTKNQSAPSVRVRTPPQSITLNEDSFPSASEENAINKFYDNDNCCDFDDESGLTNCFNAKPSSHANFICYGNENASAECDSQLKSGSITKHLQYNENADTSVISIREGTPIGDLTPHEEILYLRRQLAKLNRRVLDIEISNEQKFQREKIIYCFGLAYFVLKAILWLNRN